MKYKNPKVFSKNQYNIAGEKLKKNNLSIEDTKIFLEKLNTYKTSHSYPLDIFVNRLSRLSKKEKYQTLISQRLKRTTSIIKKLKRSYGDKPSMKLTQMQDIAGCRIIFDNLKLLYNFYINNYLNSDLKHKLVKTNNYIENPKEDGYRSLHLVYKYESDKEMKKTYNGLLIEIQFRTKIQHIWATAVEIVDFFTKQNLKLNDGEKEWKNFFKILSRVFSSIENKKKPNNIDLEKLISIEKKLNILSQFKNWSLSFHILDKNYLNKKNVEFILLELDLNKQELQVKTFSKNQKEKAFKTYFELERKLYDKDYYDIVLVSVDKIKNLQKAYPNYFLDSSLFINHFKKILNEYESKKN